MRGNEGVGGLVGTNTSTVTYCYSTGQVVGDSNVGGLIGQEARSGSTTVSFWDLNTSGLSTSDAGTGITTAEMQTAATFLDAGWDFVGETENGTEDVWMIVEGQTYPLLSWQKYGGGSGEPNDPYLIYTAEHLNALGAEPNDYDKCFKLMADIDLSGYVYDRAVIAPDMNDAGYLRYYSDGLPFTGAFDGNGHTISHLTIEGGGYLGLFGQTGSGARISNLGLEEVSISGFGGDNVGSLVGSLGFWYSSGGILTNCYSTGTVSGYYDVGGLVGENNGSITSSYSAGVVVGVVDVGGLIGMNAGSIAASHSTASVSGDAANIGGLVGANERGSITTSCSRGAVIGDLAVGGLVGENVGFVSQSYAYGSASGEYYVGGLVGCNYYHGEGRVPPPSGIVTCCYSTGMVSGVVDVGGLVGARSDGYGPIAITNSFWDMETSGQSRMCGQNSYPNCDDSYGKTPAEMQTATTFLEAGWDFVGEIENGPNDVWKITEGLDYPRLWWEPYHGQVTLEVGQVLPVTLQSNPSTGYGWEWIDDQDSIVEQVGEAVFLPRETGDPPVVGAGGWEILTFKAVSPGQTVLKLVYRRPWEEGVEPVKTFSLQVTVP